MRLFAKLERALFFGAKRVVGAIRPGMGTEISLKYYGRRGMKFRGRPNYISSTAWFDGTDYSLISIGEGATISSNVSVLTHDWALHTIGKSLGVKTDAPLGKIEPVVIGDYCFVGRGAILMPGCSLGKACVVGAGAVVRGSFDDYSIIVGNPGSSVGKSDDYFKRLTDGRLIDQKE